MPSTKHNVSFLAHFSLLCIKSRRLGNIPVNQGEMTGIPGIKNSIGKGIKMAKGLAHSRSKKASLAWSM